LRFGARQCGEHADGGQLAGFLPVEVVALENVAEQVSSEIFVGDRGELEQRPFDRPACSLKLSSFGGSITVQLLGKRQVSTKKSQLQAGYIY